MNTCPYCGNTERQVKNGLNPSGSQRYRCQPCQRVYTPAPLPLGYERAVREQAVQLYVDGQNLRRIARTLGVNHQSVANWVAAYARQVPPAPLPERSAVSELDELFTFVGSKKTSST
jgi:transposase-like protein